MNKILVCLLVLLLSLTTVSASNSISGYVSHSDMFVSDAIVTVNSLVSTVTNESGYYNFGSVFSDGDKTISVDRYRFMENISIVNLTGDYEHNVTLHSNPLERGRGSSIPLGGIIPVLSILMSFWYLRIKGDE